MTIDPACNPAEPTPEPQRPVFRRPRRPIRNNSRAYVAINALVYGLTLVGFTIGLIFPGLHEARQAAMEQSGTGDLVRSLVSNPPLFALTILAVNVLRLSALTIIIPSLVVPYAGLALFGYWAIQTGITLAPTSRDLWIALIPHSLTLLVELQAYALLLLGVYLLGQQWISPHKHGSNSRWEGYLHGLRNLGTLAVPTLALLIIGAIWEAYSLRYLVHPLRELLLT